jgi:hypothetical protein
MNLQWTGSESVSVRRGSGVLVPRPRAIVRLRDEMDRAVERMLADARGKCGVARGGRWTRDSIAIPGRSAEGGTFGPGRAGVHTDVRHRRPARAG